MLVSLFPALVCFAGAEEPKFIKELEICRVLVVADGGNKTQCLEYKSEEKKEGLPCWMSGDSSKLITSQESVMRGMLLPINLNDWEGDLRQRLNVGDYRLIGIGGFTLGYPALQEKELLCVLGGRFIEGTSDAFESKSHAKLQQEFSVYAKRYNEGLIKKYTIGEAPFNKLLHPNTKASDE